jgi:hypothetical protein
LAAKKTKTKRVTLEWYGENVSNEVRHHVARGMKKAVDFAVSQCKRKLNRSQPTRGFSSGRRMGLDPSEPGTPPKVVSSVLKNSITGRVERRQLGVRGMIGSNVIYARRQELGFFGTDSLGRYVHHEARPYLRPTIFENKQTLLRTIASG